MLPRFHRLARRPSGRWWLVGAAVLLAFAPGAVSAHVRWFVPEPVQLDQPEFALFWR